jgi:folate-binding protein YgfZ
MTDVTTAASRPPAGPAVLDYGDPAAEYAALRASALLVDHSARDLWLFGGAQARTMLTGLVTNDVGTLALGHGCYAAALTAKGRIIADLRVYAVGEGAPGARLPDPAAAATAWFDGAALVVDVPPRAADGWEALVRKFVNPRMAPYRRMGSAVRGFGVYGLRARDAVAGAFGASPSALATLAPYAHATFALDGATLLCARVPDLGGPDAQLDGFVLLVPAPAYEAAWARVAAAVPGVVAGGEAAYTVARVEAGRPEWGLDIDDTTIPQEANFDALGAISYTKGCYTGQEVVARIHFRGHVNRHLRGLAFPLDGTEPATGAPLPAGAALVDDAARRWATCAPARARRASAASRSGWCVARCPSAPPSSRGAATPTVPPPSARSRWPSCPSRCDARRRLVGRPARMHRGGRDVVRRAPRGDVAMTVRSRGLLHRARVRLHHGAAVRLHGAAVHLHRRAVRHRASRGGGRHGGGGGVGGGRLLLRRTRGEHDGCSGENDAIHKDLLGDCGVMQYRARTVVSRHATRARPTGSESQG